ncbi:MAG: GxxExxY protein [Patescibacteria group bacterium]|nr:GxxExxY protein [Patescibacteria group bacterium]
MDDFLYKELTHKIIGLIFNVYNELGFGYQEKYYQRALEETLKSSSLSYKRELQTPIKFGNKVIGRYFIDFVIDNKIVVELKISNEPYQKHFKQVLGYLKANNLNVGLLVLIKPQGIKIKRIISTNN